jgi:photosystem II stability/assembly factor-like uncharacterized protein
MTDKTSPDLLDLAEAVARDDMRPDDAERQLHSSAESVRELRGLIVAARAVRSHAQATRDAAGSENAASANPAGAIGAVIAGPVRAGAARRHPSNGGQGQPRRRTWLLAVAALLAAGGALAAGSGLLRLTSVVPSESAPASPVVAQASLTPAPAPPSPTPDEAFPATADMINHASILLASDTVGWLSAADRAIYRTRDMGTSWIDVGPTGWPEFADVRFVDADTAYVTSKIAGSDGAPLTVAGPMRIAATHDGGGSWVEATIDAPGDMANGGFSFRTPRDAFLTFFTQDGKDVRVFETTDGGRSWTGPVRSSAPRMLYLLKDLSGDPAAGNHALVLTNASAPGRPFDNNVYYSTDGGVTWAKRPFPVSDRARAVDPKGATLWADGSGRIVMAMDVYDDIQMYTSHDDGLSWQFVRDLGRGVGHVQLLSATEWIFANGSQVVSTVDGGVTWRTIEGASRIFPYEFSFASPDRGWALLGCYDYPREGFSTYCADPQPGVRDETVVFLATTDGGRTWTRIGG